MNSLPRFALIVLSILVGIGTHILWDSFTHAGYWLTDHLPLLKENVELPLFGPRPWFSILQYVSSAFGIVVLLLWALHWYRNATPLPSRQPRTSLKSDRIALACSFLIAVFVAVVRAAADGVPNGVHGTQRFMTITAITGITVFCFQILVYGILRDRTLKPARHL